MFSSINFNSNRDITITIPPEIITLLINNFLGYIVWYSETKYDFTDITFIWYALKVCTYQLVGNRLCLSKKQVHVENKALLHKK